MDYAGMSNDQYNSQLETLAKLIEAAANTPQEAAQMVRNTKTNSEETKHKT